MGIRLWSCLARRGWAALAATGVRPSLWFGRASGVAGGAFCSICVHRCAAGWGLARDLWPRALELFDHHLIGLFGRSRHWKLALGARVLQRASVSWRSWRATSPLRTTSKNSSRLARPELKGALPLPLNRRAGSAFQSGCRPRLGGCRCRAKCAPHSHRVGSQPPARHGAACG